MKRINCLILALIMIIACVSLVGCDNSSSGTTSTPPVTTSKDPVSSQKPDEVDEVSFFPLADKATISVWAPWGYDNVTTLFTTYNDSISYQYLEELTNVHLEWSMAPFMGEKEVLNLLLASQDYPDLIAYFTISGFSVQYAVDNEIAIKVDDYVDQYMPNYKAIISDPEIKRGITTDDGYMGGLFCLNSVKQNNWNGMGIRKDFLDKLGLEIPETYDELKTVLEAFRDELNLPAPMNLDGFNLGGDHMHYLMAAGFGAIGTIFQQDGVVKYGPVEPVYRDYLEMMSTWYKEGLVDPNFESNNPFFGNGETMLINDQVGYTVGADMIGDWMENSQIPVNPDFYLYPVKNAVKNKGEITHFGVEKNWVEIETIVTTDAENLETIFRWIDFCYSDEGFIILNYGVEDVTFFYDENGEPTQSVEMMESYFDCSFETIMRGIANIRMPYVRDLYHARDTHKSNGYQRETYFLSGEVWGLDDGLWLFPAKATMTAEESQEYASILNDIQTLVVETNVNIIKGNKPLSAWDDMVATCKTMKVDRIIAIKQASLDRYLKRA